MTTTQEDTRKFQTGQVVMLKSGGLPMTVSDPIQHNPRLIDVHWHDTAGALRRDTIHEDGLSFAVCLKASDGKPYWIPDQLYPGFSSHASATLRASDLPHLPERK